MSQDHVIFHLCEEDRNLLTQLLTNQLLGKLDAIERKIDRVLRKEKVMSKELDALTAQVQANTEIEESAILLINGLAAKIEAAKNDPAALQALADSLKAEDDKLAAAVAANTSAEPTA